jgi:hypothetical protein
MSDSIRENRIVVVPSFSNSVDDSTTIKMERWHYYTDTGRMLLIEGEYLDKEKFEEAVRKCDRADSGLPVEDCPNHFSIVGRPLDLVKLAKEILKFYTGYENVQY